ncbi:hypothetical protein ACFL0A_00115 [Patescibacteria group bacterium]
MSSKKYTREQFWNLYEKLPQELRDVLFAKETDSAIYDTCKRNEILDNISQVVEFVGQTLVGLLPPEEFQETLEKEVKLKKDIAKKVSQEIHRFIFFPMKSNLEKLYKIEITPPAKPSVVPSVKTLEKALLKEKPEEEAGKPDIYREPIE